MVCCTGLGKQRCRLSADCAHLFLFLQKMRTEAMAQQKPDNKKAKTWQPDDGADRWDLHCDTLRTCSMIESTLIFS